MAHAQSRFSVLIRNTAIASPTLATEAANRHAVQSVSDLGAESFELK